jgi:ADP-ribose pyrophosphatase YjhB (NUDIX family)
LDLVGAGRDDVREAVVTNELVVVHANEEAPDAWDAAVFLAGPTPRQRHVASWRPEAIEILRRRWTVDGRLVVFVPEAREWGLRDDTDQVEWEERGLNLADVVAFWVPRDLATMPAFTTNVEWGMWHASGRVVFGAPPGSPKNSYLLRYANTFRVPTATTLPATLQAALDAVGTGAPRRGGERHVPLLVWRTASFHRWLTAQQAAGNTLVGGRVVWTFRPGPERRFVLYWALHVEVHVAAEGRVKGNEVVIGRPDVAVVALYKRGPTPHDTTVVLVREFRSPASSPDGFVHELPGGSGPEPNDPLRQAVSEVEEETGLSIEAGRLRAHGSRQVAATVSAHHAHLFSAEITAEELERLRASQSQPHGAGDTEQTWVETTTFGELLGNRLVDWATLGMLTEALNGRAPSHGWIGQTGD